MKKLIEHRLYIIVFLTGACVMMLEITGSRVLAPYFGTSTIVWTSLIGLILASLSFGYWWGGRLADRTPNMVILGSLILWAALCVALLAIVKGLITGGVSAAIDDIRVGSVLVTLILFCPPSILLAMVSPFAARLTIDSTKTSGETVGRLYALSTIGSIVGTFLSGFILLGLLGNTMLLLFIALILCVAGVLASINHWNTKRICVFALTLVLILIGAVFKNQLTYTGSLIADVDTSYQRIQVREGIYTSAQRPARFLSTDSFGIQSARFTDSEDPTQLVLSYTQFYRLADHFVPHPERIMMIGGAAYSVPRDMLVRHPNAIVDVAELDPGMTRIARDFFDLQDDERMRIHHMDGRIFLNKAPPGEYDTILIDAFQSVVIPFQLTTREAVEQMHRALDDDGVVVVNIIASLEGNPNKIIRAEYATYSAVFEHVSLYPVRSMTDNRTIQNIMLVAYKGTSQSMESDDLEIQSYLQHWLKEGVHSGPILTDDYAPIERYILDMI